ncbi:MAG: hypothetical protein QXY62_04955 [Candidatus Altiarchaeota archaeon]
MDLGKVRFYKIIKSEFDLSETLVKACDEYQKYLEMIENDKIKLLKLASYTKSAIEKTAQNQQSADKQKNKEEEEEKNLNDLVGLLSLSALGAGIGSLIGAYVEDEEELKSRSMTWGSLLGAAGGASIYLLVKLFDEGKLFDGGGGEGGGGKGGGKKGELSSKAGRYLGDAFVGILTPLTIWGVREGRILPTKSSEYYEKLRRMAVNNINNILKKSVIENTNHYFGNKNGNVRFADIVTDFVLNLYNLDRTSVIVTVDGKIYDLGELNRRAELDLIKLARQAILHETKFLLEKANSAQSYDERFKWSHRLANLLLSENLSVDISGVNLENIITAEGRRLEGRDVRVGIINNEIPGAPKENILELTKAIATGTPYLFRDERFMNSLNNILEYRDVVDLSGDFGREMLREEITDLKSNTETVYATNRERIERDYSELLRLTDSGEMIEARTESKSSDLRNSLISIIKGLTRYYPGGRKEEVANEISKKLIEHNSQLLRSLREIEGEHGIRVRVERQEAAANQGASSGTAEQQRTGVAREPATQQQQHTQPPQQQQVQQDQDVVKEVVDEARSQLQQQSPPEEQKPSKQQDRIRNRKTPARNVWDNPDPHRPKNEPKPTPAPDQQTTQGIDSSSGLNNPTTSSPRTTQEHPTDTSKLKLRVGIDGVDYVVRNVEAANKAFPRLPEGHRFGAPKPSGRMDAARTVTGLASAPFVAFLTDMIIEYLFGKKKKD